MPSWLQTACPPVVAQGHCEVACADQIRKEKWSSQSAVHLHQHELLGHQRGHPARICDRVHPSVSTLPVVLSTAALPGTPCKVAQQASRRRGQLLRTAADQR
eukprot:5074709-Amphidinium_carterae.1